MPTRSLPAAQEKKIFVTDSWKQIRLSAENWLSLLLWRRDPLSPPLHRHFPQSAATSAFPELWYQKFKPQNLSAQDCIKSFLCLSHQGSTRESEGWVQLMGDLHTVEHVVGVGTIKNPRCKDALCPYSEKEGQGRGVPQAWWADISKERDASPPRWVPILVPVLGAALLVTAWYFFPALFVPADAAASRDHGVGGAGRLPEPHGSLCCSPDAADGGSEHEWPGSHPHDTNLR